MKLGETQQDTAFTTFGFNTPALNLLFDKLEGQERARFFKTFSSAQHQFKYAQTHLALELLHQHFISRIPKDVSFATYQLNAISALYKAEKRDLIDDLEENYERKTV